MSRALLILMILVMASPGLALQEEEPDFDREGVYIGAGAFGAIFTDAEDDFEDTLASAVLDFTTDADIDIAVGADVRLGYRMSPYFALEIESHINPKTDVDIDGVDNDDDSPVSGTATLETINVTANAKIFLLTGRIQPFVLAGVGITNFEIQDDGAFGATGTKDSGSGVVGRFGGGVDYYLHRNWLVALDANYIYPTSSAKNFDYISISLGIQYRF